jgi:hypothetical protein
MAAPQLGKPAEVRCNEALAYAIGRFATFHVGHVLELRGDEYNMLHEYDGVGQYYRDFDDASKLRGGL